MRNSNNLSAKYVSASKATEKYLAVRSYRTKSRKRTISSRIPYGAQSLTIFPPMPISITNKNSKDQSIGIEANILKEYHQIKIKAKNFINDF